MAADKDTIKVKIAEREFTIACGSEDRDNVIEAAAFLNQQMASVAKNNNALGADRLAIMTALNISHDLLEMRRNMGEGHAVDARLDKLNEEIDLAMDKIRQVTI